MVSLNFVHLCLMHHALCNALLIIVIIIFTMGVQLRWTLCLSSNPLLRFVAVIVQCYIFDVLWRINLLSPLSLPLRQVYDRPDPLLMSCLGKILSVAFPEVYDSEYLSLMMVVLFVLQAWYQHLMPNQQHQCTEGTVNDALLEYCY